jgi:hypothetical protein
MDLETYPEHSHRAEVRGGWLISVIDRSGRYSGHFQRTISTTNFRYLVSHVICDRNEAASKTSR